MTEVWKVLSSTHDVSNSGRLRGKTYYVNGGSRDRVAPLILKQKTSLSGYKHIYIKFDSDRRKTRYVHRLVAGMFVPNPENKPEVNHLDGNKANNHATNLEWVTSEENRFHAVKNGLMKKGEKNGVSKLTDDEVLFIRTFGHFYTNVALAKMFLVSPSLIGHILNYKTWLHLI